MGTILFTVLSPSGKKVFRVGISHDDIQVPTQIADLNGRFGAISVKRVLRRWAIRRIEQALRDEITAPDCLLELVLEPSDIELVARLAREKNCRHQHSENGELFCFAAAKDDPFVRGKLVRAASHPVPVPFAPHATYPIPTHFAPILCIQKSRAPQQ